MDRRVVVLGNEQWLDGRRDGRAPSRSRREEPPCAAQPGIDTREERPADAEGRCSRVAET